MYKNKKKSCFNFTDKTIGLPDHFFLDSDGHESIITFREFLGIDRKKSRAALSRLAKKTKRLNIFTSSDKKQHLIDIYSIPVWRRKFFTKVLEKYLSEIKATPSKGIQQIFSSIITPSFEIIIFDAYARDIFLESDLIAQVEIDKFNSKTTKPKQSKLDISLENGEISKELKSILYKISSRLKKQIAGWESLLESERKSLSEVAFSLAGLFDPELFNECLNKYEGFEEYFSKIIEFGYNLKENEPREEHDTSDKYLDLKSEEDYCRQIIAEAKKGLNQSTTTEYIDNLKTLIGDFINWIDVNKPKVSLTYVVNLWCLDLIENGKILEIPLCADDHEVQQLFNNQWFEYFISDQAGTLNSEALRQINILIKKTAKEFKNNFSQLDIEIKELKQSLDEVLANKAKSLIEKRLTQKKAGELRTSILAKKGLILENQDNAMVALFPPGNTIEVFSLEMTDSIPSINEEVVPKQLCDALIEYHYKYQLDVVQNEDNESLSVKPPSESNNGIQEGRSLISGAVEKLKAIDKKTINIAPFEAEDKLEIVNEAESPENLIVAEITDKQNPTENEVTDQAGDDEIDQTSVLTTRVEEQPNQDLFVHPENELTVQSDIDNDKTQQIVWSENVNNKELSYSDIKKIFNQEIEQGFIQTATINRILIKFLSDERLATSHYFLNQLEKTDISDDHFEPLLIKSVYYGLNNWDYGHSLTKSQRLLSSINSDKLDEWENQVGGDIVPYLILVAAFQPALFGGNYTHAPYLLNAIASNFDNHTRQFIGTTADLASKNKFVNVHQLRGGSSSENTREFNPKDRLEPWIDKIKNSHRGYAPILKAQRKCLEQGYFQPIVEALYSKGKSKISLLELFTEEMQTEESTDRLLEKALKEAGQNLLLVEIFLRERRSFSAKVFDLTDIAKEWLSINKASHGSDVDIYCRKFSTQVEKVIVEFEIKSTDESLNEAHRAGAYIVYKAFKRIELVIVNGESNIAWKYNRAKAWFSLPQNVLRINKIRDTPFKKTRWLVESLEAPFNPRELFEQALSADDIVLAELMCLRLVDLNQAKEEDAERVAHALDDLKQKLICLTKKLRSQVENANLSSLIGDSQAERLDAELDGIQGEAEELDKFTNINEIMDRLSDLEKDISKRTADKKESLHSKYKTQLLKLRSTISDNPVPDQWILDIELAFEDDNLPVITEMLEELNTAIRKGRRIQLSRVESVDVLKDFIDIQDNLLKKIDECNSYKNIWHKVVEDDTFFGIDFSNRSTLLKKVIDIFSDWSSTTKPAKNLDKFLYEKTVTILQFLGIEVKEPSYRGYYKDNSGYTIAQGAVAFHIDIEQSLSYRPFPIFGETGKTTLTIIIAFKDWQPGQVEKLLNLHSFTNNETLLISAKNLSRDKRNKFSTYFKQMHKTVMHLDLAISLLLGQDATENLVLRNFLWLVMPFTYYNPYVGGDTRFPPPREIRYGRVSEIDSLLQINNGSAIVFGGRQLGKSTILQEVHSRFQHQDKNKFSFYHLLDDMDRMDLSHSDWQRTESKVWGYIYDDLYSANIIKTPRTNSITPEVIQIAVNKALRENKNSKVIIIFDEIDPVLNIDNAHDFKLVRALRGLVNDPEIQGRFKIIIAGLESVKRFENSPNYPLPQLGGSIQITIMPTQDAILMIKEPFLALGYTFENAQVINRILAITNRHPGLIQIFCHELIKSLSVNQGDDVGSRVVSDDDVSTIYQLESVVHLIRNRFEMTLNLDLRYLVIIYGLINENKAIQPFTPSDAKEISEAWLPDEFTKLSEKQFEAFLDEMVGLGVLRKEKQGWSNLYALRNANVLKLLGSDGGREIEKRLERALHEFKSSDPLDRHACIRQKDRLLLSPITYRDEKEILGTIIKEEAEAELSSNRIHRFSVSVIVGSNAMGASVLKIVLPYIYSEDISRQRSTFFDHRYKLIAKDDDAFDSPTEFSDYVKKLVEEKSKERPIMFFVTITGKNPIAYTLAMLDAAHYLNNLNSKDLYPFRVIFYLSPKAYFDWLNNPQLTKDREATQPFIKLGKWGKAALRYALDKLGMQSASDEVDELNELSQGWYISVDTLSKIKSTNKKKATEMRDLKNSFVAMDKIKTSEAKKFYKEAALDTFEWTSLLIKAILDSGISEVTIEDIYLIGTENGIFEEDIHMSDIESMAIWMSDMNLLKRERKPNHTENFFSITSSVKHVVESVNSVN